MEKITLKKAQKLLVEDGLILNEVETRLVLDFLYEMAEIAVDQYLKVCDPRLSSAKKE